MTLFKCPKCAREKEREGKIVICPSCLSEMKRFPRPKRKK